MSTVTTLRRRLRDGLADELRGDHLFSSLVAGAVLFVLEIAIIISFAVLVFSPGGANLAPLGIGMVVIGDAVLVLVITLMSSHAGTIALGQDAPAAIMAVATAGAIASLGSGATTEARFATIAMMLVVTGVIAGIFFFLMGRFKLGSLVRYLPYPVMGGFLAGTGWLLVSGGIGTMTQASGLALLDAEALWRWLPGLLLGVGFLVISERAKNALFLPLAIVGSIAAFFLIGGLLGQSPAMLLADGWLLGLPPTDMSWRLPLNSATLAAADWPAILRNAGTLASLLIISVIALLLNANGLELIVRKDIDLSHELTITGVGNILSGLFGGLVGYHAISLSGLNESMSGGRRLPGIFMAVLLVLSVIVGTTLLSYMPLVLLGGLLITIGLSLLLRWVYRAWRTFPPIDVAIVMVILLIIAFWGFLEGIAVGLVATVVMFVVSYSRSSVVKHTLSGASFRSRVTRSPLDRQYLNGVANQIYLLQLQGFIFFGTANSLLNQVRTHVEHSVTRYVILDFRNVTGLDTTALMSFQRLLHTAHDEDVKLVITGASPLIRAQFERGGLGDGSDTLHFLPDMDHGAEWCENQLLQRQEGVGNTPTALVDQLKAILPKGIDPGELIPHLTRQEFVAGEYLMQAGDAPEYVYFIESGQVTAQLTSAGKETIRLETMQGGRTVGELGFYLGTKRSADVIADTDTVAYRLAQADLAHLEDNHPEAAYAFHRTIIHLLGERVMHLTEAVNTLLR